MVKYLFVMLFCTLSAQSIAQGRYHVDETTFPLKDSVIYLRYDMKPVNGIVYCEFGDMGKLVDGKLDGIYKEWYENAQLKFEINFKKGVKNGLAKIYHKNGQLSEKGNMLDKRDGLWRLWNKNGKLIKEVEFKEGKKYGLERWWYENGTLRCESNYKEDGIDGLWILWDENGQKHHEGYYKNGKQDGLWKWWVCKNGKLWRETNYKEGFKDGIERIWHNYGQLKESSTFKDGKRIKGACWDKDGNPEKCEHRWDDGACYANELEITTSTVNFVEREDSTIKIGNLEVMTEDLGKMRWDDAMKACADLGDGWRLPTKDELNLLYENMEKFSGFAYSYYWSSTEYDSNYAWLQYFICGNQNYNDKNYAYYVRAVRAI